MNKDEVIAELFDGMQELDEERVMKAVEGAAGSGVTFDQAVNDGLAQGIREIGNRFESGELFLPHLVMAGDLMDAAVEKLSEILPHQGESAASRGTVVIGTVKDDIHEIGKNIVALMLRVASGLVEQAAMRLYAAGWRRSAYWRCKFPLPARPNPGSQARGTR